MSLYVVRALGGGNLFIRPGEFEEPLETVQATCGKLIETQRYIHAFRIHRDEQVDVDLDIFRASLWLFRVPLLEVMARAHGVPVPNPSEFSGWLDVPPDQRFHDKVVIHRRNVIKGRKANPYFDWNKLIAHLGNKNIVFVSRLESEWREFARSDIAYYRPEDNYEHACILKGCKLFVGNQSFPSTLADALGVDRIFELANTLGRNHFAVLYANNAWYYANDWNCTIKHFRYLENRTTGLYRDLVTSELTTSIHPMRVGAIRQLGTEIHYQLSYGKRLFERHVQYCLGMLK